MLHSIGWSHTKVLEPQGLVASYSEGPCTVGRFIKDYNNVGYIVLGNVIPGFRAPNYRDPIRFIELAHGMEIPYDTISHILWRISPYSDTKPNTVNPTSPKALQSDRCSAVSSCCAHSLQVDLSAKMSNRPANRQVHQQPHYLISLTWVHLPTIDMAI